MFPHILRRRARRSRTSLTPPHLHHRDKPPPWRRPLTWAALFTLVASALYFSFADRQTKTPPTNGDNDRAATRHAAQ
jgi:hypothetical protein